MGGYILMIKPFEDSLSNKQVFINEMISLSSTLHMFIFSDYYSYEPNSPYCNYAVAPSLKIQATVKH